MLEWLGVGVSPSLDDSSNILKWQRLSISGVPPHFLALPNNSETLNQCQSCTLTPSFAQTNQGIFIADGF